MNISCRTLAVKLVVAVTKIETVTGEEVSTMISCVDESVVTVVPVYSVPS